MVINFHLDAIAAIEKGDAKAAGAAISRDIIEGMQSLLESATFADASEVGADSDEMAIKF